MSKIVFMGSPVYAVPSLRRLLQEGHKVELVICQPDKKKGRGQELKGCEVAEFARENNLPLFQPISLKAEKQECLRLLNQICPDFICCVAYGQIIPSEILEAPNVGSFNAHASLLPKWRGAAPINWGLLNGESTVGVTIQKMVAQLDAGQVVWQKSLIVSPQASYPDCYQRLSEISAEGFAQTLKHLATGDKRPHFQVQSDATYPYARKLSKDSALLQLKQNPEVCLETIIKALAPISYLSIKLANEVVQVIELKATLWQQVDLPAAFAMNTENLILSHKKKLYLTHHARLYEVLSLQKQGKGVISGRDFINSHFKNNQNLTHFEWNDVDASTSIK